ncbi:membrane fusion protein, adhesin transport system [Dyella sp. OK004]|uniref:HlyD family type I secretion periplasmic adaptor subunit n=1 Tax=Dyella sp. OK004 TaxID=1855292 RepID=UPI0008ECDB56|nr:HlyD family type I secretion periplasmic adaptor subunit [Dyella sp. OK004]SFR95194.1 membrane fusion protein, adhesin transport system [Dyella sp. OK004]
MKMPAKPRGTTTLMHPGDAAYIGDIKEAMLAQSTPGAKAVLYLIATVMVVGMTWAHFARVEEVTRAEGKVIAAGGEQQIQSLDGGIIEEMPVREGETVAKGQLLLKIDPTRANAGYREVQSKVIGLKATVARLKAEAYGQALSFPDDVLRDTKVVKEETQTFEARRRALDESVVSLQKSYDLAMKELALSEPLMRKGLMSEVEILRMRRDANSFQMQIVEQRNRFKATANSELSQAQLELAQTTEKLAGNADVVDRTEILAPVRGIIKNIRIKTIDGVVRPGETIMEISPIDEQLLVEGKIKPSDVGFVHPGQMATIKISAYDYGIYGALKGKVERVSPDTLENEKKPGDETTYYRVVVRTNANALTAGGKQLPIIPGMVSTIDIRTSEKTIQDYILKPLFKAREAFRER